MKIGSTVKKALATVVFVACAAAAPQASAAWANGGISGVEIVDVTVLQNGEFYVIFDQDICDGGAVNTMGYVYKDLAPNGVAWTAEGASMMLRTALSAKLSGSKVKVYADNSGSRTGCRMGALKIE